ncbi:hypothetical protein [Bradyrhizobium sp. sBnM-33]|uniref:hypothetical protein n=1 Tax=Bradyrhizobium sp. sBnM-33 TaxID=2831780 RepID=UPI001BCF81DA|nr:hypothetical protein [Bradyrhizobium sp. sBnM-33]WOH50103.1 hypothetical protein RX328_39705 [Bradyrhizobium sp. sBnM-33]
MAEHCSVGRCRCRCISATLVETETASALPAAEEPAIYFCELIPSLMLLVFLLVSATIDKENNFKFNWLLYYAIAGQGHQSKNISNNNNL